ncbi:MAG TPA: endonuclease/exonuclease/phosphatase family protein [Pyrinomonadaceae bacterium]
MARASLLLVSVILIILPVFQPLALSSPATPGAATRLRVMSYNVHVGIGADKRNDLARIAEVIRRERPHLVGLQEIDRGVERTKRVDQMVELARLTGMEYAFAHNLDYQGGQYGVAVLSRLPILAVDHRRLRHMREAERRGLLRVEVSVAGKTVNFVTTHLDYQNHDNRLFETRQLTDALKGINTPLIVVGDFNDEPSGDSYKFMLEQFADAWVSASAPGDGLTYPADKPAKRIDYVFYRSGPLRARRAWIPQTQASDHLPLVVDLELSPR